MDELWGGGPDPPLTYATEFLSWDSYLHLQYVYLKITRKTVANESFLWSYKKQCTQPAEKCLSSTRVITAPSTSRINISIGAKCTYHFPRFFM
jgi:hypothetical protein